MTLIEELRNRYMDTKRMLPCELGHRAADALEAKDQEIAELKAQLGRVQDKVAEYARRLLVKDSTIKQLEEERSTLQDLRDNLQALWKASHAERSEAMEETLKAQSRVEQLESALRIIIDKPKSHEAYRVAVMALQR